MTINCNRETSHWDYLGLINEVTNGVSVYLNYDTRFVWDAENVPELFSATNMFLVCPSRKRNVDQIRALVVLNQ